MVSQIFAGDTLEIAKSYVGYTSSEWTATLYLYNQLTSIAIPATPDGENFSFTKTANETSLFAPGKYNFVIKLSKDGVVNTIERGVTEILPNVVSGFKTDIRTHAQKVLEAIEAVLEQRATREHSAVTIEGKSITLLSFDELLKAKSRYEYEVMKSKGLGGPKMINVTFS